MCFNQFKQPRKKIDGALNIPYNLNEVKNFGNVEEEILSHKLPEVWNKIYTGLICYQISTAFKADHYGFNSDESVLAFVNNAKCRKSTHTTHGDQQGECPIPQRNAPPIQRKFLRLLLILKNLLKKLIG